MSSNTTPSSTDPKAQPQPCENDDGHTAHVRLVSSSRREKTAKEAERSLDAKLAKAHAGKAVPDTPDPTPENPAPWTEARGEPSGLPPVTTVRPKPAVKSKAKAAPKETAKTRATDSPSQKTSSAKAMTKTSAKPKTSAKTKTSAKSASKAKAAPHKGAQSSAQASSDVSAQSTPSDTSAVKASVKGEATTAPSPNVTAAPASGLLASLIGFAPAGVTVDTVPDDRPQAGEVKGSPETVPQGTLARLKAETACAETVPDEPSNGTVNATPNEMADNVSHVGNKRAPSKDTSPSSPTVMILSPAPDSDAGRSPRVATTATTASDDAPRHTTVELTGRRSAPKRKPEPMEPDRETIDLEAQALADDAVAEMTLLKRRAARQPQRDELEARMARAGAQAAGLTLQASDPSDMATAKAEADVALWANDARRANQEHQARVASPATPAYDFASDDPTVTMAKSPADPASVAPRLAAAADYAERMTEWENRVLEDAKRRDRLTSPFRRQAPAERIPIVTAANETLGGFPAARDVRPWVNVDGTDVPPPPPTAVERWLRLLAKIDRLTQAWQGLHAALKTSLVVLGTSLVAAVAAGLTAHAMVPGLTERHTPVSVTAVVADNEIRDLMMLVSLLEARQVSIGRTAPTVSLTHLPSEMRARLEHDTPDERMALPLDDRLLKAALRETADWVGAPILSKSVVLAMPDIAHAPIGHTLDVTEEVVKRLGLAGVSAAAAKEALIVMLNPRHEPNLTPFAFDRLTVKTPTDRSAGDAPATPSSTPSSTPASPLREETRR